MNRKQVGSLLAEQRRDSQERERDMVDRERVLTHYEAFQRTALRFMQDCQDLVNSLDACERDAMTRESNELLRALQSEVNGD